MQFFYFTFMFEILIISKKFIFIKTKNKEDNIEREKKVCLT